MHKIILSLCFVAVLQTGCHSAGVYRAKGGNATHNSPSGVVAKIQQPENPKDAAKQDVDVEDTQELVLPAGSAVPVSTVTPTPSGTITNVQVFTVGSNTTYRVTHREKSHAQVGASQADVVGETIAKLKAVRWLVGVGIVIFIGGLACAFVPYLEAFFGGILPGLVIAGGGLVLTALPYLIVGNEKLIVVGAVVTLGGVLGAIYVHKHGGIMAELAALKADAQSAVASVEKKV